MTSPFDDDAGFEAVSKESDRYDKRDQVNSENGVGGKRTLNSKANTYTTNDRCY